MSAVRYYLDEHIDTAIPRALVRAGIEFVSTQSAGRRAATDESNIAFCLQQDLVIVTNDQDYLRLAAEGIDHAGIAFCRQDKYLIGGLIDALVNLAARTTAEDARGQVFWL